MMKTNNQYKRLISRLSKGADMGDVNVTPGYIHPSYAKIEEFATSILDQVLFQ